MRRIQGSTRTIILAGMAGALALGAGLAIAAAPQRAIAAPHVLTDKAAYVDGELVTLSGYGFLPSEVVSLQVASTDASAAPQPMGAPWTAFADAEGKLQATWRLDPRLRPGLDLVVMATGASSRTAAQFAFHRTALIAVETPVDTAATSVKVTGSNFVPNENVTLRSSYPPAAEPVSVTADDDGGIAASVDLASTSNGAQLPSLTALGSVSGLGASVMALAGTFNIDGNVPDAGALQFGDPYGAVSELGPVNSTNTKLLAISGATVPMLGFTNPNAQVDLRNIWMATSIVNGDAWLYFAWERDSNSGSGAIAFEFQQNPRPAACDYTKTDQVDTPANTPAGEANLVATCNPWANRQPGDFLIVWDQSGGKINIIKRTFYLDATSKLALDAGVVLSATDSSAAYSADKYRGEAAINLSHTVFPPNPTSCFSIANIIPATITGNSDTADFKDTVLAEFASRVAVSNCGQIKVTKVTQPAGGTGTFPYTLARTNGNPVRFPGDGGQTQISDTLLSDGDFDTIFDLIAGNNYTLTEGSVGPAYAMLSINCGGTDLTSGGTFNVTPSTVTSCTITNKLQNGTLIVKKVVTNDDGGTAACSDFSFSVNGGPSIPFEADCQNEISVPSTTTYNVVEFAANGYATTYDGCSSVQVPAGGTATCTVTNNDKGPALKLVKSVTNDNGGTGVPADWQLTATGTGGFTDAGSSTTFHSVKAGVQYTLSESAVAGYDFVSWSCNGGTFVAPNKITIGLDQQVTCTVSNNDRKATPGVGTTERAVLHDSATITGIRPGAPGPAATVTFRLFSDAACGTQVGTDETVAITNGTAATVNGVLVTQPGTYYWRAVYSGDAYNDGKTTDCGSETTTVTF